MTTKEKAARIAPALSELTRITARHMLSLADPSDITMSEVQDLLRPELEKMKDNDVFMDLVSLAVANLVREKIMHSFENRMRDRSGSGDIESVTE